jgi:hypothetical protein
MNSESDSSYIRVHKKVLTLIIVLTLIAGAGLVGWWIGRTDPPPTSSTQSSAERSTDSTEVSELVRYELPDGWEQSACEGSSAVYISPNGTTTDCDSSPVSPIKLSLDAADTKDCNELQNVTDVKKHICISLYINGLRSLKATTEYLETSSYKKATTIYAYYVDTGKGVVKVEYLYNSDNQFQASFDQLVNTINVKN